ncbi:hypothetical protein GUJ93_ZPchr0013g36957 [Zizania palustris]|uniref:Uncharacterized protein n=1 Tax=Zizania palustris TaxID=103762 RepID=A0A8J5X0C3_ZIZPA|nr:hypothetical protein GUJ93_ZPchr0013g36957 [Zizania palustris]
MGHGSHSPSLSGSHGHLAPPSGLHHNLLLLRRRSQPTRRPPGHRPPRAPSPPRHRRVQRCGARGYGGGALGEVPVGYPGRLGLQKGSRRQPKRKGRELRVRYAWPVAQKSRSGPGVRRVFEGGQMPLYRRIPKLRGIAGGMHIGLPKYVPFNLRELARGRFEDGDEISLEIEGFDKSVWQGEKASVKDFRRW